MENCQINTVLIANISQLSDFADKAGYKDIAKTAKNIISDVHKQTFSVAVVGEFSRGKSTLINKLLGKDVLPVGDLPTTAMLTSIKYGENDSIRFSNNTNEQVGEYQVSEEVWDKICDNKSQDELANEKAFMSLDIPWLQDSGIEIFDTPGAGDLEEARAKVIGDALMSCDAAIIAISATSPFSMSEKLFIEQRLIAHKIPFLMVVVTKLDLIREKEREGVLNYIKSKLQTLKVEIPIIAIDDSQICSQEKADEKIEAEDADCQKQQINCIDKIKELIIAWKNTPERIKLIEKSMAAKAFSLLNILKEALKEKKAIIDKDDNAIKKEVEDKKLKILQTSLVWENLRIELEGRSNDCVDYLFNQISIYKNNLIETLRKSLYETDDLKDWTTKIYPNKTRLELAKIATDLSSDLSSRLASDKQWFYKEVLNQFNVKLNNGISLGNVKLEAETPESFKVITNGSKEKSNKLYENIGTVVFSLGLCILTPIPPVISVMGGKLLASYFMKKIGKKGSLSDQRSALWKAIQEEIPNILNNATSQTKDRVKSVYKELANESEKQEKLWKSTQEQLISELTNKSNTNGVDTYVDILDFVKLSAQFKVYLT